MKIFALDAVNVARDRLNLVYMAATAVEDKEQAAALSEGVYQTQCALDDVKALLLELPLEQPPGS